MWRPKHQFLYCSRYVVLHILTLKSCFYMAAITDAVVGISIHKKYLISCVGCGGCSGNM